ncbi:MAG: RNA-binding protein [Candidatus Hermodarchaeota archaeon]|jgi:PUA-domain protein|nr:RNA-binding protein [Candidatus Hermodarchaeota archaeon]
MRIKHRTLLRTKELRTLLSELVDEANLIHTLLKDPTSGKGKVEQVVLEDKTTLYFVQGTLWLVVQSDRRFPGLPALLAGLVQLPQVVVDMGAVPHIANGADVMAPGIVEVNPDITKGELVVIIDQKNRTPLAIGCTRMDAKTIVDARQGRAIETLHYVGDPVWNLAKELSG